jgi:hypothetical protein
MELKAMMKISITANNQINVIECTLNTNNHDRKTSY